MSDVTLAGPVSVAVDGLRTLIANIPFFQTWTAADDAAAALLSVFTGEVGYPVVSLAIASNVATVVTREPHQIEIGDIVTIQGASIGAESLGIEGPQTVLDVGTTSFTFSTASYSLPDQGPLYPDQCFVVPTVRPIAVVTDAADPVHSEAIGTGGAAVFAGALEILLEADVSKDYLNDPRNALYEARNSLGSFMQGLATTQGTGDLMCLNRLEISTPPEFVSQTEQDDNSIRFERWRAVVRVTWGIEG